MTPTPDATACTETAETVHKYRVGDPVRVIRNRNTGTAQDHCFPFGTVRAIRALHKDGSGVDLGEWSCGFDEIEPAETAETVTVPRGPLPEGVVTAVVCDYLKMAERDPILREIGPVSLRALWSVLATHFAAAPALSPQHPVGVREALERVPVAWMNSDHVRQYQENTSSGIFWASPVESDFYDTALFITAARSCVVSTSIPEVSNAELAQMALCQVAWIEEGKAEHPHRLDTIRDALARLAAISHPPAQDTPGAVKVKALNDDDFPKEIYVQHPSDADFDGQRWSLHDDFDGQHKAVRYVREDLEPSPPLPEADGEVVGYVAGGDISNLLNGRVETAEIHPAQAVNIGEPLVRQSALVSALRERGEIAQRCRKAVSDRIGHEIVIADLRDKIARVEADRDERWAQAEKAEQVAAGLRERILSPDFIKEVAQEYLSHRGERPWRILRGGQELWEAHTDAIKSGLVSALRASTEEGKTATPSVKDEEAGWQ